MTCIVIRMNIPSRLLGNHAKYKGWLTFTTPGLLHYILTRYRITG